MVRVVQQRRPRRGGLFRFSRPQSPFVSVSLSLREFPGAALSLAVVIVDVVANDDEEVDDGGGGA